MRRKQIWLLVAGWAALLVVGFGVATLLLNRANDNQAAVGVTEYRGTLYEPPLELSDFTLPASNGEDVSLSDLRGEWVLMFFGYTHCPDFCPLTLSEYRQIMDMLGADASRVQVVFVSVDSARDTPVALARYLERFNPDFLGLSGDDETLARIQPEFGFYYERHEEQGEHYLVDHSTRSYLIDPDGRLRISYSYGTEREVIAESIRDILTQG